MPDPSCAICQGRGETGPGLVCPVCHGTGAISDPFAADAYRRRIEQAAVEAAVERARDRGRGVADEWRRHAAGILAEVTEAARQAREAAGAAIAAREHSAGRAEQAAARAELAARDARATLAVLGAVAGSPPNLPGAPGGIYGVLGAEAQQVFGGSAYFANLYVANLITGSQQQGGGTITGALIIASIFEGAGWLANSDGLFFYTSAVVS